jgi:hypothetical protein
VDDLSDLSEIEIKKLEEELMERVISRKLI